MAKRTLTREDEHNFARSALKSINNSLELTKLAPDQLLAAVKARGFDVRTTGEAAIWITGYVHACLKAAKEDLESML